MSICFICHDIVSTYLSHQFHVIKFFKLQCLIWDLSISVSVRIIICLATSTCNQIKTQKLKQFANNTKKDWFHLKWILLWELRFVLCGLYTLVPLLKLELLNKKKCDCYASNITLWCPQRKSKIARSDGQTNLLL